MKQPAGRRCDTVHSGVAEIGEQANPGAVAQPPLHVDAAVAEHTKRGAAIDTGQARHDFAVAEIQEGAIERQPGPVRSAEHTSELQSLMRIPYAGICLTKKNYNIHIQYT